MHQYYADEATKNPIWLFQTKERGFDNWRTGTVFSSRKEAEEYGRSRPHEWGEIDVGWRVYSVCCKDERLCKAMAAIRPDLIDECSFKIPATAS